MKYRTTEEPNNPNFLSLFLQGETAEEVKYVKEVLKQIQSHISKQYNVTFQKNIKPVSTQYADKTPPKKTKTKTEEDGSDSI